MILALLGWDGKLGELVFSGSMADGAHPTDISSCSIEFSSLNY